jgi:hypothetical protein
MCDNIPPSSYSHHTSMRPLGCFLWNRVILFNVDSGSGSPPGPTYVGRSDFWLFRSLGFFLEIMVTVLSDSSKFSLAAGSQFTLPLRCIFGVAGGLSVSLLKASDKTLILTSVSKHSQNLLSVYIKQLVLYKLPYCFCICRKDVYVINKFCSHRTQRQLKKQITKNMCVVLKLNNVL